MSNMTISAEMHPILATLAKAGEYRAETKSDRRRIKNMHGHGIVSRHPTDMWLCYPTELGRTCAAELGLCEKAAPAVPPALQASPVVSDLVAAVERARALFQAGDVIAAMNVSAVAYDQAKAAAGSAERVRASQDLIDKARRLQADALKIESMCWIATADAVDNAQAAGQISLKGGRPETVQASDRFTLDEVGIDKRRLHEARKLRDKDRAEPDFLDRTIEARIDAGLEPTRASLRHAIGTRTATKEERGDQLYETPAVATRALLALESFSATVKEPAVGRGAISRVLEDAGYEVVISDLRDRGTTTRHGELQQVGDFMQSDPGETLGMDLVSNPPYGDQANSFLAHALKVHRPRKMAVLLNANFMFGFEDPDRHYVMHENPPSRVYLFSRRLPMMHRDGWDGPTASSQMNTAFYVWEQNADGSYGRGNGQFECVRIDWQRYEAMEALPPGDGGRAAPMIFVHGDDEDFTRTTPRKSLDERIDAARKDARTWIGTVVEFSRRDLRRDVGVRDSVAEALIEEMVRDGLVGLAGSDGVYTVLASASVAA